MSGVRQIFAVRVNQLADWYASGRMSNALCVSCNLGSFLLVCHIRPTGVPCVIDSGDFEYVSAQLGRCQLRDYDHGWTGAYGYEVWQVVPSEGYYC